MPTGYTADLKDGKEISFRDFVLQCSRAFGATVLQRDEPHDVKPRLREIDLKRHEAAIQEANERLMASIRMSVEEAELGAMAQHLRDVEYWEKSVAETKVVRERYEGMLAQVKDWVPPTGEHLKLKAFMIDQLEESIKFDCQSYPQSKPEPVSGAEYRDQLIKRAQSSVVYNTKYRDDEITSVEGANAWITALYDSLPMED